MRPANPLAMSPPGQDDSDEEKFHHLLVRGGFRQPAYTASCHDDVAISRSTKLDIPA